jgi:hypothetical protein
MRRIQNASAVLLLLIASLGLGGCSEDKKVDAIQVSPEAKKADEGAQQGMRDFIQSKGQAKAKAR